MRNGGRVRNTIPANKRFDFAIATFVFEVICPAKKRHRILEETVNALKPGGVLVLAIRGPKDIKATGLVPCHREARGFLTKQHTFIRKFSVPEITNLLRQKGMQQITVLNKVHNPKIIKVIARRT